jgi:hypothetical protein
MHKTHASTFGSRSMHTTIAGPGHTRAPYGVCCMPNVVSFRLFQMRPRGPTTGGPCTVAHMHVVMQSFEGCNMVESDDTTSNVRIHAVRPLSRTLQHGRRNGGGKHLGADCDGQLRILGALGSPDQNGSRASCATCSMASARRTRSRRTLTIG